MPDQRDMAKTFASLHIKGDPIIIYNAWDAGSAKAIEAAGARAVATGDHPVGYAHGYTDNDFDDFSFDTYFVTIQEIAKRVSVPFSVDISNAVGLDLPALQARIHQLLELGVVGINFEDRQADSSGVLSITDQAERIAAIRAAADDFGVALFINARTDLFILNEADAHAGLLADAVERAHIYKTAGANGFFTPGLLSIDLIQKLCQQVDLPVNIIRLPTAPSSEQLAHAGVARISYGPVVQMQMIDWLKEQASQALAKKI